MGKQQGVTKMEEIRKFIGLSELGMCNALEITLDEYLAINEGIMELTVKQFVLIHRLVRNKTDRLLT